MVDKTWKQTVLGHWRLQNFGNK